MTHSSAGQEWIVCDVFSIRDFPLAKREKEQFEFLDLVDLVRVTFLVEFVVGSSSDILLFSIVMCSSSLSQEDSYLICNMLLMFHL